MMKKEKEEKKEERKYSTAKVKERRMTPYERTRAYVYSTGNKWMIENFNATHN